MNVVIYARYSSHNQHETSIEGQLKVCYEYCTRNNYNVINEYIDRALSGTTDNRPEFLRMIEDASKHGFQYIIVYQLDRFSRNRYDSAVYKAKLKKHNVRVLSARENISDDASGILMESVLEGMAEYYSAELSQKVKRGMDINAKNCKSNGGNITLGYKVDSEKHFQIDENNAAIVRTVFELYAKGKTVAEIIKLLNSQGHKTSTGGPFNKNSLRIMLKNKRYIGIYTYKDTEIPNGIPRIISDELFYKVAEIMEKNRKAPARSKSKSEYLLTTKLFCGYCREMMRGYSGTSRTKKLYNYYICNGKAKKTCNKKIVPKDSIENYAIDMCRQQLTSENIFKIAKEVVKQCEKDRDHSNLNRLHKQLHDIERKQRNLMSAIMECDIESARRAMYAEVPKLETALENIQDEIAKEEIGLVHLTEQQVRFFLTELKNGNINSLKYQKILISVFINSIYLYDDKITIIFNSSNDPVSVDINTLDWVNAQNTTYESSFLNHVGTPYLWNKIDVHPLKPVVTGFFGVYMAKISISKPRCIYGGFVMAFVIFTIIWLYFDYFQRIKII